MSKYIFLKAPCKSPSTVICSPNFKMATSGSDIWGSVSMLITWCQHYSLFCRVAKSLFYFKIASKINRSWITFAWQNFFLFHPIFRSPHFYWATEFKTHTIRCNWICEDLRSVWDIYHMWSNKLDNNGLITENRLDLESFIYLHLLSIITSKYKYIYNVADMQYLPKWSARERGCNSWSDMRPDGQQGTTADGGLFIKPSIFVEH